MRGLGQETAVTAFSFQLEVHPFTDSISSWISLARDGELESVRYNRQLLTVSEARKGRLTDAQRKELRTIVSSPEFQQAAQHGNFGGDGLSRGDQFRLILQTEPNAQHQIFGFLPDAPPVVRRFVQRTIELGKQGEQAPLAPAHIRSEPIDTKEADTLRRNGVRFLQVEDFAGGVRAVLLSAMRTPGFVGLNAREQELILARGEQFLVLRGDAAWRMTLFKAVQ